jgi:ABC-type nitrate/sulfonate/bicarbonate transport system substrate-binding protein
MSRRFPIFAALIALEPLAIRACWLALVLTAAPGVASAADKLVLQLHRAAQFEFGGYYAALWQGFYREAGFDVEIKSGAPSGAQAIDPVREIAEGRAQFGTETVQLLIRAAQGQSLLLLAPIFNRAMRGSITAPMATSPPRGRCLTAGSGGSRRATVSTSN